MYKLNKGFYKSVTFIAEAEELETLIKVKGEAVELTLSNGEKFICGTEQLLFTADNKWVEAQDSLDEYLGLFEQVVEVKEVGEQELYDITVKNDEHKFKIRINETEITVHNISSIPTFSNIKAITVPSVVPTGGKVVTTTETTTVAVDTTIYIPETIIQFTVSRLKPNTRMYAFFDGKDVTSYVQPTGGNWGDNLITDDSGYAEGNFKIPNNANIKFIAGQRDFILTDSSTNSSNYTTKAIATYTYTGTPDNQSNPSLETGSTFEDDFKIDPVIQTFTCNETGGMFINKIGLYFYAKDTMQPVLFQIREVVEDKVMATYVAGSSITLNSSNITTNTDPLADEPTWINFENPIYLSEGKEYAIFLVTNSTNYILHSVEYGKQTNNVTATKDISSGSLMKYIGVNNWVRDNSNGIKYIIQKCKFDTTNNYTLTLKNSPLATKTLKVNSLFVDATNDVITVTDPDHAFNVGSFVTISNVPAGSYGNIPSTSINGVHRITSITWNTYSFDNFYTGNVETDIDFSTAYDYVFGNNVKTDYDIQYDNLVWNPSYILLTGTDIQYQYKGLSGQSIGGTEQPYSSDSTYNHIEPKDTYICNSVKKVSSVTNSSKFNVNNSIQLVATLKTINENVSPMIDKNNISMIAIENVINNDNSSETVDSASKSCAKMIWKTIQLYEQATGIQVTFLGSVQASSDVKVYYKVLSVGESANIEDIQWTAMNLRKDVSKSINANDFQEYTYQVDNVSPFRSFKIKLVMTSDDSTKVPLIKKFSAIAFAK